MSFESNILSRAIQSAFEINIAHNFSRSRQHKSSRVSCSISEETSPVLREIISNFKEAERAKFPSRIRTIVFESFQGSRMQFQRLVMSRTDMYVTADCYQVKRPDKPRIVFRYK